MDGKLIRALQYLYYSLFLITPLLMFHKTSELFEFNKMLFIYLITGAIALVWLSRMVVHKSIIIKNTLFSPVLLLFLASQVLSTIFSIDHQTSIFGYYGRFNGGLLSILSYVILYFAFVSNFSGDTLQKTVRKLLSFSLIGSILVILWGLPSKFGYDLSCLVFTGNLDVACWTDQFKPTIRVFSTLGQPNWMGAYLAVNFFIGLYFYFISLGESRKRNLYALYLFGNLTMLLFARSRSALMAVGIGMLLFIVYFLSHHRKQLFQKSYRLSVLILVVVCVAAVLTAKTGISSVDQFISFNRSSETRDINNVKVEDQKKLLITDSFSIRKIVWQGGYTLGLAHPLFGTGVETFAYAYNFVRPIDHNATSEWDYVYNKAHNEFVNYFATTGAIGVGLYVVFLGVVISQIIILFNKSNGLSQEEELLLLSSFAGFISLIVTNFFGFSITVTNLYLYILPACVVAIIAKKKFEKDREKVPPISKQQKRMLAGIGVVMVIFVFYVLQYFYADVKYALGDNLANVQDYNGSLTNLYAAYSLRSEHVYADKISNVLAQVTLLQAATKGDMHCVSHKNELKPCTELVEYYGQQAVNGSPKNPYYYRTIARNDILLYQATGDEKYYDKAIASLQTARQLAPTDPRYPYTLALFYLAKYENTKKPTPQDARMFENKALPTIDFALQLKPDYRDGMYGKVLILKQLKKNAEAKALIEHYLQAYDAKDEQFLEELKSL
jgi:O-antigen ligase